ncbi:MAG: ABC transporter ATP-binding protein [Bryobacteraceae bacterium]
MNLSVDRGETLGIVGPNGCGKSTLLQIVGGILEPTCGRVATKGRLAALLELGAGFNPDFTGRENVFLSSEIMGLSRAATTRALPSIEAFAELGEFLDRPVKEYSSGMYVRLAFSTAIHVEPEILIVDEALAVGDAIFANRCIRKFDELKRRKVTVLFVSHDLGLVKRLSDRAIFLMNGRIEAEGDPTDVINRYIGAVLAREQNLTETQRNGLDPSHRHGDGTSEIVDVALMNGRGEICNSVSPGESVTIRVRCRFRQSVEQPMIGILIRNRIGMDVYGTNTKIEEVDLGKAEPGEELDIEFRFDCWLTPQEYTLTVAAQHADGSSHDWMDDVLAFEVVGARSLAGVADLRAEVAWNRQTRSMSR